MRDKTESRAIGIVFLILLLVGMFAVAGYGIGTDENTEIDIARMDLKEYVRIFPGEDSRIFRFLDGKIGDLMDSVEIDHGEALLYPAVVIVSILRELGRTDLGMYVYHIYLYLWFLIGLLALYGAGKWLTGRKLWGVCAAGFVWLNPLFFGTSFTNNKDVVMMSLVSICIYAGIRFVEEKNLKWSILWAISIAFCANMRVIGFAYAGLFGALYLLEFLLAEKKDWKVFRNGIAAILVMFSVFILITPATWYSVWEYFQYTLINSASFSRWNQWILYNGEFYNYLEKPLPWHYLLVSIGITTPLLILLFIVLGQINMIREMADFKKNEWTPKKYLLLLGLAVWTPMLFYMLKGANVYGGWRHFYFIYPELVLLAVVALAWLGSLHKRFFAAVKGMLILQVVMGVFLLAAGHPFQNMYFNIFAGRPVAEQFEYASTSIYKEALEKILEMDQREKIGVSSDNLVCYHGIKQAWEILSPEKKARIWIAEPETAECDQADYHVYGESTLRRENRMALESIGEAKRCEPEKKFDSQMGLDAYGYRIITIYYNQQ